MMIDVRATLTRRIVSVAAALVVSAAYTPAISAQHTDKTRAAGTGTAQVLSGGVGEGARDQLAQQARGYNLKIVFALSSGNYLSEVPFQVMRGSKVIVDEVAQGPWAFVKLRAGSYTVKATHEGKTLTRQVSVAGKGQKKVAFTYHAPARVAEQPQSQAR